MPRARVKFKPPGETLAGPFKLSTEHPDDQFRFLSAYPRDGGLLVLLEATMTNPSGIVDYFGGGTEGPEYEVLHADDETALVQFLLPFVPPPYRAILDSGNLPQFPYTIQDGWIVCELATSHERLSQFRAELEATGFAFEIVSVSQSLDPTDLLTDRQRRFVTAAIEHGYYDTPRTCSLTDLADELDVSKSTASVVLHNAEETIVKEFFAESGE